jgi:hypothetical protein
MAMKHFEIEEWVDFVNGTVNQEQRNEMQQHLAAPCRSCAAQVALWQKVRDFCATEAAYQPPEQAVRDAGVIFRTAERASVSGDRSKLVELLFDSLLQPAIAGARAAGSETRQMLYRAGSFQIDLQIEAKPAIGRIAVTGQVLDVGRPEIIGSGLKVTLANRRGNIIHALTNEFGEFHAEIPNSGDLELALRNDSAQPIVISLKDPLADLPGSEK